jgi:hypothetical protein
MAPEGVPDIIPVSVSIANPFDKAGEILKVYGSEPSVVGINSTG